MSADEPTADEVLAVRTGTRVPFTMVGDWVLLSDLSPQAKLLYALLAAHINIADGDRKVWPSLETLGGWMGVKQPRSVSKYIDELVKIGALRKQQQRTADGLRTRNAYYVEGEPPAGLTTPTRFSDFYAQRAAARRELAGQAVVRPSALRNDQGKRVSAGEAVVRSSAVRGAPDRQDVARSSAPEQDQLPQLDEGKESEPPLRSGSRAAAGPKAPQPAAPALFSTADASAAVRQARRARRSPAVLNAEARTGRAVQIVNAYAATCDRPPPRKMAIALAREIDDLLSQNWSADDLGEVLALWGTKPLGPGAFQSVAQEWSNRKAKPAQRSRTAVAVESTADAFAQLRARRAASEARALEVRA